MVHRHDRTIPLAPKSYQGDVVRPSFFARSLRMVANLQLIFFELSQRATKSEGELRKAAVTTNYQSIN
jgi:hypothetical protein